MAGARRLLPEERTKIDERRIDALVGDMGRIATERLLGRAIEEIDWRLMDARIAFAAGEARALQNTMRHLIPVANTIGLAVVAQVAADVAATSRTRDTAAVAATLARLERLCDGVVPAIGDAWSARS